ncbi:hypothetical protein AB0G64_00190 [Streptomyces longwoodensis]|uniref:hypothetical protein n=1 Tax=Streptomyces longwoodensis TaxID=68231 RepID=UPI0033E4D1C5
MIQQAVHAATGAGAADLALALGVAHALHAPVTRAPEVAGAAPAPAAARRTAPPSRGARRRPARRAA